MKFDEYAEKHLEGLSQRGRELVAMGWNARGAYGDHIPDATKMVEGTVQAMGDLHFNEEDDYKSAVVIEFASREDFKAAIDAGQCRFTVFGGDA